MDTSNDFKKMLDRAIEAHPDDFKGFDRIQNVQDQLQAMVTGKGIIAGDWRDVLARFVDELWTFEDEHRVGYWRIFTSMEQLWLAFVMKEQYNKVWNGKDWIKTS
jgi:predicted Abi (CAAX) family protease